MSRKASKSEPKNGAKIYPKMIPEISDYRDPFLVLLGVIFGFLGKRDRNDAKLVEKGAKMSQERPQTGSKRPKIGQRWPKTGPKWPKTGPRQG